MTYMEILCMHGSLLYAHNDNHNLAVHSIYIEIALLLIFAL